MYFLLAFSSVLFFRFYLQLLLRRKVDTMTGPEMCARCSDSVPKDGRFMKCADCALAYHLGKKCSGVSEGTFKGMCASKHEKWRCVGCRGGLSKSNLEGDLTPSSQVDPIAFMAELSTVNKKLDLLLAWKDTVDSLHDLHPKVDALLSMKQEVDTLRDSVNTMQESMSFVSSQYDSLVTSVKSQATIIKGLQAETCSLKSIVSEQAHEIQHLKTNQNDIEQSNRLSNLEVHGIPFSPQENTIDLLTGLAQRINIEGFHPADIVAAHRLPVKSGAVPPVLIRFSSVSIKEQWMGYRGRLGYLPHDDSDPRIYFNENLTDSNRKLFWMARTRGKEKNFKFVWVRHGKIYAKQSQNSPLLRITDVGALDQIT